MTAVVLAGGYDQIALVNELKRRGYYVIIVDYFENPPAREAADRHLRISTLDHAAVLNVARETKAALVTTACTDQALLTAAYVSQELKLPFPLSHDTAVLVTDKECMKARMISCGIPTARYRMVERGGEFTPDWSFPWVVKPADCNSSKGVKKVLNESEYRSALKQAWQSSRSGRAVVEEFREGRELSVDAQICGGISEILLVTCSVKNRHKPSIFPIVQTQYPVELNAKQTEEIKSIIQTIAKNFELDNTFLLVQMIATAEGLSVIEFSARMGGGGKYYLISMVTGADSIKNYVDSHFKTMMPLRSQWDGRAFAMNYVYALPGAFRKIEGMSDLIRENLVEFSCAYKTAGMEIHAADTSGDRIGGFLVTGAGQEDVRKKTRQADSRLRVLNDAGDDIMIHGLWNAQDIGE